MFIGVLLFAYYKQSNDPLYYQITDACSKLFPDQITRCLADSDFAKSVTNVYPFSGGDKVFPDFITKHMPSGLSGLVVAAIFAAALSSSLNSIAATAINDLYKPFAKDKSDKNLLRKASILTVIVGIVQILVAIAVKDAGNSALSQALSIASLINGPVLGVFLVGTFVKKANQTCALIAMLVSISLMLYIYFGTKIAFPWYAVIGSLTTLIAAFIASLFLSDSPEDVEVHNE